MVPIRDSVVVADMLLSSRSIINEFVAKPSGLHQRTRALEVTFVLPAFFHWKLKAPYLFNKFILFYRTSVEVLRTTVTERKTSLIQCATSRLFQSPHSLVQKNCDLPKNQIGSSCRRAVRAKKKRAWKIHRRVFKP